MFTTGPEDKIVEEPVIQDSRSKINRHNLHQVRKDPEVG